MFAAFSRNVFSVSSDFPFDLAFSAGAVFGHINDVEKPPICFPDVSGLVHENAWHGAMKTELEGFGETTSLVIP